VIDPLPPAQPPEGRPGSFWRRWNRIIHRDVGYFCVALTLVYAVSGIAVNHIDDWNPNYVVAREERRFEPVSVSDQETMVLQLVSRLALPGPPKASFRRNPEQIQLFYDGWSVVADAPAGTATIERTRRRFLLFDANYLHLNRPKGLWTWAADIYAGLLGLLAVTGIFILHGRQGLGGRGKWFILAGLAVPVVFLIVLRAFGPPPPTAVEGERHRGERQRSTVPAPDAIAAPDAAIPPTEGRPPAASARP
jgi:hypothetical protein